MFLILTWSKIIKHNISECNEQTAKGVTLSANQIRWTTGQIYKNYQINKINQLISQSDDLAVWAMLKCYN